MDDSDTFELWLEDEIIQAFAAFEDQTRFYWRGRHRKRRPNSVEEVDIATLADTIAVPGGSNPHLAAFRRLKRTVRCHYVIRALRRLAENFRVEETKKSRVAGMSFSDVKFRTVNLLDALAQASAQGLEEDDDESDQL